MLRLRISQVTIRENCYRVDLEFEGDRRARQTASVEFDFRMSEQDQADLRWYLEDYLQYPQDPAPVIAARVEARMAELGTELFNAVFPRENDDARDLWATIRTNLDETVVEVITTVEGATAIPWELIRDAKTDVALSLRAASFVRAQPNPAQRPELPKPGTGPIRILLVICRPGLDEDVPFRSVASRLIKGLSEEARAKYQLDVLRPATFEQLALVLRRAKLGKKPYHVVHFDGHGTYAELGRTDFLEHHGRLSSVVYTARRAGRHGFLLFENSDHEDNVQFVDGPTLGSLLVETHVPVLVLNACRSAHSELQTEPEVALADAAANPHAQVRAIGSLAQEVMDAGVAGVVAMRYNVYVVTAAQFVADLYATLVRGQSLGTAVAMGRKQLAANPLRTIAYEPIPLQDWSVPIIYEAAPITLFPKMKDKSLTITIRAGDTTAGRGAIDDLLPQPPDIGFFGRDETLLALDRAFDTHSIVLLHAYAGSGKTSTAAEFARWYAMTGGVEGPILFTSFEQYTPLPRVLDRLGQVFGPSLEQAGIHWLTLNDAERRDVALQVLGQVPVFWIWDNIEPVAGFPEGMPSAWNGEEQAALVGFLRESRRTKAKFLLTSRRDERSWLADLPGRIKIGPMPMQERVQLARALSEKHGRRIVDIKDWRPLLQFTGGNPLTITVLVGQAVRDRLTTRKQIDELVSMLQQGEAQFDDDEREGRSKSLGASLGYGFEHAFTEDERKQLALIYFFRGYVNVDIFRSMGDPDSEWCLAEMRGLTREAGTTLLDRASEIGLLTKLTGISYAIHPAVPWFFRKLFNTYYSDAPTFEASDGTNKQPHPTVRAFLGIMSELGEYAVRNHMDGIDLNRSLFMHEEANLMHSYRLARHYALWGHVVSAMQGLRSLYRITGRPGEWSRLVNESLPDLVDPDTDGPRPGREEIWTAMNDYRVSLARERRDWQEAERLQRIAITKVRGEVESIVSRLMIRGDEHSADGRGFERSRIAPSGPSDEQSTLDERLESIAHHLKFRDRQQVASLAFMLDLLGEIQLEREDVECIESHEEAFHLAEQIDDRTRALKVAYNLGTAYKNLAELRDLGQAEFWYRRSLEFADEQSPINRGYTLVQLGTVSLMRFEEGRSGLASSEELQGHLNSAMDSYTKALGLIPESDADNRGILYQQLGILFDLVGDIENCIYYCRRAIEQKERVGDFYSVANVCRNVALTLARNGRLADARAYAIASRNNYDRYGVGVSAELQSAEGLIDRIDQLIVDSST